MPVRWPRSITQAVQGADFSGRPAFAGLAIVAALVVASVVALRLHDAIARERENVTRNGLVLGVARARAAENVTLARTNAVAKNGDLRASIEHVFARHALPYRLLDAQGSEALPRIVIEAAPFDALVRALDALSREEGVRVTGATLTARVDPGTVRAELELAR
jgi:type II secretory pathway component PulM